METKQLTMALQKVQQQLCEMDANQQLQLTQLLLDMISGYIEQMRKQMSESDAVTIRRRAKARETAIDPKRPVKPVRVAEPSKPKKPKYSGNHAPTARR